MIFFMSVVCFMDRLHHWSNTDADVARVCLVNRLVSLTSCGLWDVQTMQRERGAVHFVVSLKTGKLGQNGDGKMTNSA